MEDDNGLPKKSQRDSNPNGVVVEKQGNSQIEQMLGISEAKLKKWRLELRANGHPALANGESADQWSSQDKFLIVIETANMCEAELSEYCRQKGLYPEQVLQWQENCQNVNTDIPGRIAEIMKQDKAAQRAAPGQEGTAAQGISFG